jgi:hypothetical protein
MPQYSDLLAPVMCYLRRISLAYGHSRPAGAETCLIAVRIRHCATRCRPPSSFLLCPKVRQPLQRLPGGFFGHPEKMFSGCGGAIVGFQTKKTASLVPPKILEPCRRQFRISNRVANIPMSEVVLNSRNSHRKGAIELDLPSLSPADPKAGLVMDKDSIPRRTCSRAGCASWVLAV